MPPRELWDERAATVRAEGTEAVADATMERWFSDGFRAEHPETVAEVRTMVASTPAEGYAACCEAIREWDFRDSARPDRGADARPLRRGRSFDAARAAAA